MKKSKSRRSRQLKNKQPNKARSDTESRTLSEFHRRFLREMELRNCSPKTLRKWGYTIGRFTRWALERGIETIDEATPRVLDSYRRYLYDFRIERTGKPLAFGTQAMYLIDLRRWFAWLEEAGWLAEHRAEKLVIPKEGLHLPANVMTADEAETVLNQPDVTTDVGLRDRAILETFYTTAMRCSELLSLDVYDLLADRGVMMIRQGKGRKDRVVPVGERALQWLRKYLTDVRPRLARHSNETALFLSVRGNRIHVNHLSYVVRRYVLRAGITRRGSCHMIRHTTATLMMEGGADLRALQQLLGHSRLDTTQIYTHVSIQRLKEVHARTHPAKPDRCANESETD